MGSKQCKPTIDVHTVQQRLSRSELLYLKNLFIHLCTTNAPASSSSSSSLPALSPQLNQSHSSAALASPSNLELMSLRLPRAAVIKLLLGPAFPSLSHSLPGSPLSGSMLDRFYACFDYHGYGSAGIDYSEFLVMIYTLWYASPHEELSRFLFGLCDLSASGRVSKKEYRKVAAAIWADQALAASTAAAADATANKASAVSAAAAAAAATAGVAQSVASAAPQPKGKAAAAAAAAASAAAAAKAAYDAVPLADREWITALFDFYFHLACYHFDRDHDKHLNAAEFANFAEDDLLLSSFLSRGTDARMMKQRLHQQLQIAPAALVVPAGGANSSSSSASSLSSAAAATSLTGVSSPTFPLGARSFLGDEDVEESSGALWRSQRRSLVKIAARKQSNAGDGAEETAAAVPISQQRQQPAAVRSR